MRFRKRCAKAEVPGQPVDLYGKSVEELHSENCFFGSRTADAAAIARRCTPKIEIARFCRYLKGIGVTAIADWWTSSILRYGLRPTQDERGWWWYQEKAECPE
jgi:hypothetical protein